MFKVFSDVSNPDLSEIGGSQSARSVLANKRGISTSISESLGGIAIGIMVMALLGVGIGAAYNYSQDSSAKSSLDSVKSSEVLYQAKNAKFADFPALTGTAPVDNDPALSSSATNVKIAVSATGTNYCAIVKSGSMFPSLSWISSRSGNIVTTMPTLAEAGVACPTTP